jgi:hypothetical protein
MEEEEDDMEGDEEEPFNDDEVDDVAPEDDEASYEKEDEESKTSLDSHELEWIEKKKYAKDEKVHFPCPYPGCKESYVEKRAILGHVRFRHWTHGEYLDTEGKLISGPKYKPKSNWSQEKPKVKAPEPKPEPKGQRSASEMEPGKGDEGNLAEIGKKAEVKGKLRLLLRTISEVADPGQRNSMMPTREVLMDYIKRLSLQKITDEEVDEIDMKLEDNLIPEVRKVLGDEVVNKIRPSPGTPAAPQVSKLTNDTRAAKLRGNVRQYLLNLTNLPQSRKDMLMAEREVLLGLSRRLLVKDLKEEDLNEVEDTFENEARISIDSAIQQAKAAAASSPRASPSDMELQMAQKKEELELVRADRLIAEEEVRRKQSLEAMRSGQGTSLSGTMVPLMRPKMTDKGELVKDDKGQPVMETTYVPVDQAQNQNNILIPLLMSGKLGGNDNMTPILVAMMNNQAAMQKSQTDMFMAMIANQNKGGPNTNELMLQMENNRMKMMADLEAKRLEANKAGDPQMAMMRDELKATRDAQQRTQDAFHKQQLDYMHQEMTDLKQYAYRDTLGELEKSKERLERLGIINPASKDAETKALEESSKLTREGMMRLDKATTDLKELFAPMVAANAAVIQAQAGQNKPLRRALTDEEKKDAYRQILDNIEQEEEEG